MTVIVKKENKRPYIITMPKEISNIKKVIGNEFEELIHNDIIVIYNRNQDDERLKKVTLLKNLELKGNIIIAGNDTINGDIRSLTKKQLRFYSRRFRIRINEKENEI